MDYKNKYLKYKHKYIELKNNQTGGLNYFLNIKDKVKDTVNTVKNQVKDKVNTAISLINTENNTEKNNNIEIINNTYFIVNIVELINDSINYNNSNNKNNKKILNELYPLFINELNNIFNNIFTKYRETNDIALCLDNILLQIITYFNNNNNNNNNNNIIKKKCILLVAYLLVDKLYSTKKYFNNEQLKSVFLEFKRLIENNLNIIDNSSLIEIKLNYITNISKSNSTTPVNNIKKQIISNINTIIDGNIKCSIVNITNIINNSNLSEDKIINYLYPLFMIELNKIFRYIYNINIDINNRIKCIKNIINEICTLIEDNDINKKYYLLFACLLIDKLYYIEIMLNKDELKNNFNTFKSNIENNLNKLDNILLIKLNYII